MSNHNSDTKFEKKGGDYEQTKRDIGEPLEFKPLEVHVRDGNFDRAFKAFRAIVQKERTLSLYKEKQRYEKPSDKRRRKRKEMSRKRLELEFKSKNADKSQLKTKKETGKPSQEG